MPESRGAKKQTCFRGHLQESHQMKATVLENTAAALKFGFPINVSGHARLVPVVGKEQRPTKTACACRRLIFWKGLYRHSPSR